MICNVFRNPKLQYRFKYLISVILPNEEAKHCTKSFTPVHALYLNYRQTKGNEESAEV